jgi:methyl coenzyme M reductase gamma subunit
MPQPKHPQHPQHHLHHQYNTLNIKTLKGNLLINIRDRYIEQLVKKLIDKNIIPTEFLNDLVKLEIAMENHKQQKMQESSLQLQESSLQLQESSLQLQQTSTNIQTPEQGQTKKVEPTPEYKYKIIKNKIMKECFKNTAKLIVDLSLS